MLRVSRVSRCQWALVAVQGEGLCLTIKSVSVCLSFLVDIDRILLYRSIDERTLVYFADNPRHILEADIERGKVSIASGFAAIRVQVQIPPSPNFLSLFFFFP